MGTRSFVFLSGKLLNFFLGLCDYSGKFPKMFCSSYGMECPSTANFCHQYGQQLNLSQVSNKAASSVDKEKLLKNFQKCWVKQHMNSYHCLISHSSSNLRLFHMTIFQMHYEYIIYPVTGINTSQRLILVIPRSLAVSVETET